ncbi:hypothetical protein K431DRAFT_283276 [Polychaeton citri CBS 116435]|uniref:Nucleolar protein 12 n=1 Tax=Polychaeton citri CBS 116435 TaxID=1314669 RepID=A0A9P4Q9J1_9PEZI|nr:hypothetical protein K431DRAFT_283276 [Polychaeton citri CBS 116435]
MAEKPKKSKSHSGREKDSGRKEQKRKGAADTAKQQGNDVPAFSLLAKDSAVDTKLGSLFAVKQPATPAPAPKLRPSSSADEEEGSEGAEQDDEKLSELDSDERDIDDSETEEVPVHTVSAGEKPKKKRKRGGDDVDDLEQAHLQRLAREEQLEAQRAASERAAKRLKSDLDSGAESDEEDEGDSDGTSDAQDETEATEGSDVASPPKHESLQTPDVESSKANRTVFLGNVALSAITSKTDKQTLTTHLASIFSRAPAPKDDEPAHKVESIRFRSTPYAASLPKKAAFAKQDVMEATSHATNAYAVYSSQALARTAAKLLNGTVVLDRHLRVDEVAHPSKIDHKRCVFVGNLGFVDDERNIQLANAEAGRETTRKPSKHPADSEEGLWRTFGRCGSVESVRVIRDSKTRVGIGVAYVQFHDENAVEAALLLEGKKFPPMLPRNLRVSRAKAMKRNATPGSGRPGVSKPAPAAGNGYVRKIGPEEASRLGRTGKLFGKAAAAAQEKQLRRQAKGQRERKPRSASKPNGSGDGETVRKPESFVFEGHRASAKSGSSGLKLGGKRGSKGGKPSNRSVRRAAAYKASGKGKK